MRVLVTRPEPEATRWAGWLRGRGLDAVPLPLIEIGAPPDPGALQETRDTLARYDAVMFVSANAVRSLLAETKGWPPSVRAWAPGGATAAALQAAGVPPGLLAMPAPDAEQWDSEHLWAEVAGDVRPGFRLLLVRGGDATGRPGGREWLGEQVERAGGQVTSVVAYTRSAPDWDEAQRRSASEAAGTDCVWLFSSSEAIRNLAGLLPAGDWSAATALVTHPRIAQAASPLQFGRVGVCGPELDAVVASIESLR